MRAHRTGPALVGLAACLVLAARPAAAQPGPHMAVDTPANTASVAEPFQIAGWAIDTNAATGTGVDAVHIWGTPSGGSPVFLGAATYGGARPDIGQAFGSQFTNSAYWLVVANQPIGSWQIIVYAHSTVTGTFNQARVLNLTLLAHPLMWVDTPVQNAATTQPFTVAGWAVDLAAQTGPGVDAVHVWAYPNPGSGAAAVFLGAATYGGSRPDLGAAYGSQFTNSGFTLTVQNQDPGEYRLIVYARSTVTGTFNQALTLTVFVDTPTVPLMVDVAGSGTGTVTSSLSGLNCTPATTPCTLNVPPNQAVTLTATPDGQQNFTGWQGGCAGTSTTCQVTLDQAKWAVARFAPAPTMAVTYYHVDALGSVRALSDQSGAILARHDYGAFGEDTAPLGGDPRRFTGKELDPESAWMYFGARSYRNVVGRFTSVDPVFAESAVSDPQLWNRFSYVRANPLRYVDPDGRCIWDLCIGEISVATIAAAAAVSAGAAWLLSPPGRAATRAVAADVSSAVGSLIEVFNQKASQACWTTEPESTYSMATGLAEGIGQERGNKARASFPLIGLTRKSWARCRDRPRLLAPNPSGRQDGGRGKSRWGQHSSHS